LADRSVCVIDVSGVKLGYTTKTEAEENLSKGLAKRESARCIRMLANQVSLRGLSAVVGETLAAVVRRGETWAKVALEEIQR
jgi:hypothetical protein